MSDTVVLDVKTIREELDLLGKVLVEVGERIDRLAAMLDLEDES